MIDLDAIWAEADDLYCHLGAALCLGKIPYSVWMAFSGMFCHYKYILPNDRYLNPTLMDVICTVTAKNYGEMRRFILLLNQVECHFTEQDQARMLSILITAGSSRKRG